jgi:hypothetical protein
MPRKQRFKPTRKPKPAPTSEIINGDALIGHRVPDGLNETEARPTLSPRDEPSRAQLDRSE